MKKYSVTIRVDGRNYETKPFYSKSKETAIKEAEKRARKHFYKYPYIEEVDAVNIEIIQ